MGEAVNRKRESPVASPDGAAIADFCNPPARFRGAPFWSWNDDLDGDRLLRQIAQLGEMGFGGFHMHVRTGMRIEYLGGDFMDRVKACVGEAARRGMYAWLYDEDRWPSGYGGGLVTADPRFRQRYLLFTARPYGGVPPALPAVSEYPVERNGRGKLLARYEIRLVDGRLEHYRRLPPDEQANSGSEAWHAYLETEWPCIGYNNRTLSDMFNPEATRRFLEITHERYNAAVGRHFGRAVPAIFTDEPHPHVKRPLPEASSREDVLLPFTDDFAESFRKAYGEDLLDSLPELVWDLADGRASIARWRYHDHAAERFVAGFLEPIRDWCDVHGIASTGHLVEESTLDEQTVYDGEAMRGYRAMQLPGVDILGMSLQLNTAKQAQSAARQFGRPGVVSELYGLTGWGCTFAAFKRLGDWQAALGVTRRVPHLSWVSMRGEAKRDCPGPISSQQPWWREWRMLEDHFSRLNVILSRGRPVVHVAVIHPVESYWLRFGPRSETAAERNRMERQFSDLTEWLLTALIDFDFLAESLLPGQAGGTPGFRVGEMSYDAVIVPPLLTIRGSTLKRLEAFADSGGSIFFAGDVPGLVDVNPSDRAARLAERCRRIPFAKSAVLDSLSPWRELSAATPEGEPSASLVGQLRQEGDKRYLFVCNTDLVKDAGGTIIRVNGRWDVALLDTLAGTTEALQSDFEEGWTRITRDIPAHGHFLAELSPRRPGHGAAAAAPKRWRTTAKFAQTVPVRLEEPNVLPLDLARWRWNEESWRTRQELRSIEDEIRRRHGLQVRRSYCAQPWTDISPSPSLGTLMLEFEIRTGIGLSGCQLALEQPSEWVMELDGSPFPYADRGFWVDEAIRRLDFPAMAPGVHTLRMTTVFTRRTELEWAYLLGDFGVELHGMAARIVPPVRKLRWGDWTGQGLPFYTGNAIYECNFSAGGGPAVLHVVPDPAPLLAVSLDGRHAGRIAFAPYRLGLGRLEPGGHKLEITAFGHRGNAFDRIHRKDFDAYELKPMGIASPPEIVEALHDPPCASGK